jgi:ribonuclease HI
MKELKFSSNQIPSIIGGHTNTTIRLFDDKSIEVGDLIKFIDSSNNKSFGYGLVEEVSQKRLYGLKNEEKHFEEKCKSDKELLNILKDYYGDSITLDSIAKVIKFNYLGKRVDKLDVNNTTKVKKIKLYTDGGSRGNPGPSAGAYVIFDSEDKLLTSNGIYLGRATNNQAEYQAVKQGLLAAEEIGASIVHVYIDSLLIVNQIKGEYKIKNSDLLPLYESIKDIMTRFEKVYFTHVPREMNKLADAKVNEILDSKD